MICSPAALPDATFPICPLLSPLDLVSHFDSCFDNRNPLSLSHVRRKSPETGKSTHPNFTSSVLARINLHPSILKIISTLKKVTSINRLLLRHSGLQRNCFIDNFDRECLNPLRRCCSEKGLQQRNKDIDSCDSRSCNGICLKINDGLSNGLTNKEDFCEGIIS